MKTCFIGCGNMASAIMGGILKKNVMTKEEVMASDVSEAARKRAADTLGITVYEDNCEMAAQADILVLAVKPFYMEGVIAQIHDVVREDTLIVSIAAGKTVGWIEQQFQRPVKLVRTMPNTPALVGEGVAGICCNERVSDAEKETVLKIFRSFGKAEIMTEAMIDVVGAVSGSSPAYVFMFIEAMADAAVAEGMPRAMAYEFASQAVLGSAKMVLETGKHPGELKDMVCSPAGTTIEGVQVLETKGMRSAVMEAIRACVSKTRML